MHNIDQSAFEWLNPPDHFELSDGSVRMTTEPHTDLWQRTYYGFRNDNAHALLLVAPPAAFTFSFTAAWQPQGQYDQCGLLVYQDADNWFKASVEYEDENFSRLGSVVTNLGYSDWATTDISSDLRHVTYRLSRRADDFRIEYAMPGQQFVQMRIFHMHHIQEKARVGIYACSPLQSSFEAVFTDLLLADCLWQPYSPANT